MSQSGIMRAVIEKALDKALRDMEENKERSIRNLVDLGAFFSKSAFHKGFFEIAQNMLEDKQSPYYKLITDVVERVDHENVKTFGINMGYNCWTAGAKKLRQYEKENGRYFPWATIFNASCCETGLDESKICGVIDQGTAAGANCYMFFIDHGSDLNFLISVFRKNRDCAFVLFAHPAVLDEKRIIDIKLCRNTLLSVHCESGTAGDGLGAVIELLQNHKCFFGVHTYYNDENSTDILNGGFVKRVEKIRAAFAFLIQSKNCSGQNVNEIKKYIKDGKTNQKYSTFLIDLYEDIDHISRRISGGSCQE